MRTSIKLSLCYTIILAAWLSSPQVVHSQNSCDLDEKRKCEKIYTHSIELTSAEFLMSFEAGILSSVSYLEWNRYNSTKNFPLEIEFKAHSTSKYDTVSLMKCRSIACYFILSRTRLFSLKLQLEYYLKQRAKQLSDKITDFSLHFKLYLSAIIRHLNFIKERTQLQIKIVLSKFPPLPRIIHSSIPIKNKTDTNIIPSINLFKNQPLWIVKSLKSEYEGLLTDPLSISATIDDDFNKKNLSALFSTKTTFQTLTSFSNNNSIIKKIIKNIKIYINKFHMNNNENIIHEKFILRWFFNDWKENNQWHDTEVLIAESKHTVGIFFRGSDSTADLITNTQTMNSIKKYKYFSNIHHGSVHRGIFNAYSKVNSGQLISLNRQNNNQSILANIYEPLFYNCLNNTNYKDNSNRNTKQSQFLPGIKCLLNNVNLSKILLQTSLRALRSGKKLLLSGHSLGGALASLLALDIFINHANESIYEDGREHYRKEQKHVVNKNANNEDKNSSKLSKLLLLFKKKKKRKSDHIQSKSNKNLFISSRFDKIHLYTFGEPEIANKIFIEEIFKFSTHLKDFLLYRYKRFISLTKVPICIPDIVTSISSRVNGFHRGDNVKKEKKKKNNKVSKQDAIVNISSSTSTTTNNNDNISNPSNMATSDNVTTEIDNNNVTDVRDIPNNSPSNNEKKNNNNIIIERNQTKINRKDSKKDIAVVIAVDTNTATASVSGSCQEGESDVRNGGDSDNGNTVDSDMKCKPLSSTSASTSKKHINNRQTSVKDLIVDTKAVNHYSSNTNTNSNSSTTATSSCSHTNASAPHVNKTCLWWNNFPFSDRTAHMTTPLYVCSGSAENSIDAHAMHHYLRGISWIAKQGFLPNDPSFSFNTAITNATTSQNTKLNLSSTTTTSTSTISTGRKAERGIELTRCLRVFTMSCSDSSVIVGAPPTAVECKPSTLYE
eukprot:gene1364-2636_t